MVKALLIFLILQFTPKIWADIYPPKGVNFPDKKCGQHKPKSGNVQVTLLSIPSNKMNVITYIWCEDFNRGLKPIVDLLKKLPAVIFNGISQADADRVLKNLNTLGCKSKATVQ